MHKLVPLLRFACSVLNIAFVEDIVLGGILVTEEL